MPDQSRCRNRINHAERRAFMNGELPVPHIAILDNDPITLRGLTAIIEDAGVGHVAWTETSNGQAVRRCLDPNDTTDLLLVDMYLGSQSGADVCSAIRTRTKAVALLAVTSFPVDQYERTAALAGAQGIVSKADIPAMLAAIRTTAAGGTWGRYFDTCDIAHIRMRHRPQRTLLSERETSVMNLMATGCSVRDAATQLGITESAVKTFLSRAKAKLNASTLRRAVAIWTGEADA